jgi:SAM-dependent methyltransferase
MSYDGSFHFIRTRKKRFMLAPANIPEKYRAWNARHGAPHGWHLRFRRLREKLYSADHLCRALGPFSIQTNNSTREFEYPWAFEAGQLQPGMRVLEIGGGLSGFQFALDVAGIRVVNVDPGGLAGGKVWACDEKSIARLNRIFGTHVDLRPVVVEKAGLAEAEFDGAYCISVIEHLTPEAAANVMAHVFRSLKPGGRLVLTVDLSLNLSPFTKRQTNEYGVNRSIPDLFRQQPWELVAGQREEMFGFPEFDAELILSRLENYHVGHNYPVLAQCLVLRKPAA